MKDRPWAIVLAAGRGTRLQSLTTDGDGRVVPKQFCSLDGGPTMVEAALARARSLVGPERTLAVVAEDQRAHWEPLFDALTLAQTLVEPRPRGTAAGLVLPLLAVLERDPDAIVAVLPSDHSVQRESILQIALHEAIHRVRGGSRTAILLGAAPDGPVPDYGWILPEPAPGRLHRVRRFVEKPTPNVAARLFDDGALWNTFMLVARASVLLELIEYQQPALVEAFGGLAAGEPIADVYERLEPCDLSRDVLQRSVPALRVQELPPCGWTDLGTPERVAACLRLRARQAQATLSRLGAPVLARAFDPAGLARAFDPAGLARAFDPAGLARAFDPAGGLRAAE